MRMKYAIFCGATAALAVLAAPTLAKNSNPAKADDKPAASSCHAYQRAADGSWTALPCQGSSPPAQTQHKPPSPGADDEAHGY